MQCSDVSNTAKVDEVVIRFMVVAWRGLGILSVLIKQDAVLSQGVPHDVAVNFGTYQSFQRHWAVFTEITMLSN